MRARCAPCRRAVEGGPGEDEEFVGRAKLIHTRVITKLGRGIASPRVMLRYAICVSLRWWQTLRALRKIPTVHHDRKVIVKKRGLKPHAMPINDQIAALISSVKKAKY